MRIESGRVETGRRHDRDWPHHERRETTSTVEVPFERAFEDAPTVVVGLSKVEWEQPGHKLLAISAQEVTRQGFTLVIESGFRTELVAVSAFWLAC